MNDITSQTILLVEDEEIDVYFMQMAWEKVGVTTRLHVVEDGQEAIDYLSGRGEFADRKRHPLPALVLLDLKLPVVMGMDVLKWIREKPDMNMIVVVVVTSSQLRSDINSASALGANSYLVKPTNPLQLFEMVDLVNRYWLNLNQPTATIGKLAPGG